MKILFAVVLTAFTLISCSKTNAPENIPDPPDTPVTRLQRTVEKIGADSITTEYFYDLDGRLIRMKQSGIVMGSNKYFETWITRNGTGAIAQIIDKGAYLVSAGIDSQLTVFNYNVPGNKPSFSRLTMRQSGVFFRDSTVYEYDGSGRIVRDHHYQYMSPNPVQRFSLEFVRSANGNIDSTNTWDYSGAITGYTRGQTLAFKYDAKENPLKLDHDAIFLYMWPGYGPNNLIQEKGVFPNAVPPMDYTTNFSYTYRSDNLPATATKIRTPGVTSIITYYY